MKNECSIKDCSTPILRQNWCGKHYWRWYRHGDPEHPTPPRYSTPEEALRMRVKQSGECLLWTGTITSTGYGSLRVGGTMRSAHIVAYQIANGPIPAGLQVDHRCHQPLCVNVKHLRLVTHKQNQENLSGPYRNSTSGVRGVSWCKKRARWSVSVKHNNKIHWVGYFHDIKEAERAAIRKRLELFTHNDLDRKSTTEAATNLAAFVISGQRPITESETTP